MDNFYTDYLGEDEYILKNNVTQWTYTAPINDVKGVRQKNI